MWCLHMTPYYICIYFKPKFFITFYQLMLQENEEPYSSCGLSFLLKAGLILSTLDNFNLQIMV